MNSWYTYYSALSRRLLDYIKEEKCAALHYLELAKSAPTAPGEKLLLELAKGESEHGIKFSRLYLQIIGEEPILPPACTQVTSSYYQAIEERILAVGTVSHRYGEEFLNAPDMYLRNLFYHTKTEETNNGLRLMLLLRPAALSGSGSPQSQQAEAGKGAAMPS